MLLRTTTAHRARAGPTRPVVSRPTAQPRIPVRRVHVVADKSDEPIHIDFQKLQDLRSTNKDALEVLTGIPRDHLEREVHIYRPSKSAMQSGTGVRLQKTRQWFMQFKRTGQRWNNPIMGWQSSRDPVGVLTLSFSDKNHATTFAENHGFNYRVLPDALEGVEKIPADYSANFKHKAAGRGQPVPDDF